MLYNLISIKNDVSHIRAKSNIVNGPPEIITYVTVKPPAVLQGKNGIDTSGTETTLGHIWMTFLSRNNNRKLKTCFSYKCFLTTVQSKP